MIKENFNKIISYHFSDLLPYECNFCILNFDCRLQRNAHIRNHFKQKYCIVCEQNLIKIGDDWYELRLHIDKTCNNGEKSGENDFNECIGNQEIQSTYTEEDVTNILPSKEGTLFVAMPDETEFAEPEIKIEFQDISEQIETQENTETNDNESIINEPGPEDSNNDKPVKSNATGKIECDICKKMLTKSSINNHKKIVHQKQKLFKCDICDKSLSAKILLKLHMSKHTGIFEFICSYCGRGFNTKHNFNLHLNTHTGNRPFVCTICGRAFKQDSPFRQHMLAHQNIKPYKCKGDGCDKAYAHLTDLKRHHFKHHGIYDKEIICPLCSKQFGETRSLRSHLKSHKHMPVA